MGKSKKTSHSKSRSKERDREEDKTESKLQKMQSQIDNLTKVISQFIQTQEPKNIPCELNPSHNLQKENEIFVVEEIQEDTSNKENQPPSAINANNSQDTMVEDNKSPNPVHDQPTEVTEDQGVDKEILEILGEDPGATTDVTIKSNPEINVRSTKWMREDINEDVKKALLKEYSKIGHLNAEAPKINLEIAPAITAITKKRDQHFVDTQNCIGSAVISLSAAISMILDGSEEGIDQLALMKYLCDTGKMITSAFHQHSVARKSFITPLMNKAIKPVLDATVPDEWLYGSKLTEQVKEAKVIEKACANIKAPDKVTPRITPFKTQHQGNWKGPPAYSRQVGGFEKKSFLKFKPKTQYQPNQYPSQYPNQYPTQYPGKTPKTTNQSFDEK